MSNNQEANRKQIQHVSQDTRIYQRELSQSKDLHFSLTQEERIAHLKSQWQAEIDSQNLDLSTLLKREKAKALTYPFSSETEATTADVLAAINSLSKDNGFEEIPYTEIMGLLGVSSALNLPAEFSTLTEKIGEHRPFGAPDPDVDPSLAWFYWQVDRIGENLSVADEFFQMQKSTALALFSSGNETVVAANGNSYQVEPLVDNPSRSILQAQHLLCRYPSNPTVVNKIVETDIKFNSNHFRNNPARIFIQIEDSLTYLYQRPLLPDLERKFGDETVSSSLDAINQLRKHFSSSVPTFTLDERLYWMGRSAFFQADGWSPHASILLSRLRHGDLESKEVIDMIEPEYDRFYDRLKVTREIFAQVKDLHAWNFLSERSLLAANQKA